jgi:hypothetical protein
MLLDLNNHPSGKYNKSRFENLVSQINSGKVKMPLSTTIDLSLLKETYILQYRDELSHQEKSSLMPKTNKYSVTIHGDIFDLLSKDHRLLWYLDYNGDIRLYQNTMEKLAHQAAPFLKISFNDCYVLVKELSVIFADSQEFIESYIKQKGINENRSINYFNPKVTSIQLFLFWIVLLKINKDSELKALFLLLTSKILPVLNVLQYEVFEDKLVFNCLVECAKSEMTSNEIFEYITQKQSLN